MLSAIGANPEGTQPLLRRSSQGPFSVVNTHPKLVRSLQSAACLGQPRVSPRMPIDKANIHLSSEFGFDDTTGRGSLAHCFAQAQSEINDLCGGVYTSVKNGRNPPHSAKASHPHGRCINTAVSHSVAIHHKVLVYAFTPLEIKA